MRRRPDPLQALARLRRLETGAARRRLAEDADRLAAAEARAAAAHAALLEEREAAAARPADYAAWVGRGVAERDRAALGAAHATERLEGSRAALAAARVAERCIDRLVQDRARAAAARLLRQEQAATDEVAGRAAHASAKRG